MTVKELIKLLKKYPQDLQVVYCKYSERALLTPEDLELENLCVARDDGWVQNLRPDMPSETYLSFPGN